MQLIHMVPNSKYSINNNVGKNLVNIVTQKLIYLKTCIIKVKSYLQKINSWLIKVKSYSKALKTYYVLVQTLINKSINKIILAKIVQIILFNFKILYCKYYLKQTETENN